MKTKRYPPLIATIVLLYLLLAKALWMGSKCSEVSLGNWPKSFIRWSAFKSEDIPWMSCSEAMWAKALFTRSVHRDFIKYFSSPSWNNHATRNQYTQTYSIMQTKILPLIFYISTYKFFERSPCLKDFWRWLVLCRRVWCYQWEQGPCPGTPRDSSVSSARMTRRSSGGALQLPPSTSCQGLDRDGLPGLRGTPKE